MFRLAVALILITFVCGQTHATLRHKIEQGGLIALNWVLAITCAFLVLSLPAPHITLQGLPRAFDLTVAMMAIFILSWWLAKFLLPIAGHQKVLAAAFYIIIGSILIFSCLTS